MNQQTPPPMEITLSASLEAQAALDIRTAYMALPTAIKAAIRRDSALIRLPMGLRLIGNGNKGRQMLLVPGRPTVHAADTAVAMTSGEQRALVDYDRIKNIPSTRKLVREMEMQMVENIRQAIIRDLDKTIEAGERFAAIAMQPEAAAPLNIESEETDANET